MAATEPTRRLQDNTRTEDPGLPAHDLARDKSLFACETRATASSDASPSPRLGNTAVGRYHVFRGWGWELASTALSVGLLIAMFVLICEHHGRRIDEWRFPINLSTLLALIATVFRILILIPVTSIISHSKWDWVGRDQARPLKDIQSLDAASRGPWGAAGVISLSAKGNMPALTAAILSILTLVTAPFVQQAIETVTCDRDIPGPASVPYAHFVPRRENLESPAFRFNNNQTSNLDISIMVQACQAKPEPTASENRVQGSCSTGNCTFPDGDPIEGGGGVSHSTIGMCSRCIDTSAFLRTEGNASTAGGNYSAFLPNGHELNTGWDLPIKMAVEPNLTWVGAAAATPAMRRLYDASLLNLTTMVAGRDRTMTAATCVLYTCLRSYQTVIRDNELVEDELPSRPTAYDRASPIRVTDTRADRVLILADTWHTAAVQAPCRAEGRVFSAANMSAAANTTRLSFCEVPDNGDGPCRMRNVSAPEACIYRHHGWYSTYVSGMLKTSFTYDCDVSSIRTGRCKSNTIMPVAWLQRLVKANQDRLGSFPARAADAPLPRVFGHVEGTYANFTASMTNRFRMGAGAQTYGADGWFPASGLALGRVDGRAWQTTACYRARLGWLALPAALLAGVAALLGAVFARSWARRAVQPVWKETLLPLVLYRDRLHDGGERGLRDGRDAGAARGGTWEGAYGLEGLPLMEEGQMTDVAGGIPVRFRWGDEQPAKRSTSWSKLSV